VNVLMYRVTTASTRGIHLLWLNDNRNLTWRPCSAMPDNGDGTSRVDLVGQRRRWEIWVANTIYQGAFVREDVSWTLDAIVRTGGNHARRRRNRGCNYRIGTKSRARARGWQMTLLPKARE
jgi:hypothetical protein